MMMKLSARNTDSLYRLRLIGRIQGVRRGEVMEEEWRFGTGGLCDGNSTRDCELALPLQSGRWMTNEVCLFHSLFFFSSSSSPPPHPFLPLHTSPLCPGGERKGEFMWERLTATQSHFYSAPPPACFTFPAAGHAVHANTQAGRPIRRRRKRICERHKRSLEVWTGVSFGRGT